MENVTIVTRAVEVVVKAQGTYNGILKWKYEMAESGYDTLGGVYANPDDGGKTYVCMARKVTFLP